MQMTDLDQFTGTENYYPSSFGSLNLTDGIQFLREKANCYWLIDIVESVQHMPKVKANNSFLVWMIEVCEDKSWKVSAWEDLPGECVYIQEGSYTDFPFDQFEFYQEGNVLLLKSEH